MKKIFIFTFLMGCAEKSTDSAAEESAQPSAEPEASEPTNEPETSEPEASEPETPEPTSEPEASPTSDPTTEPTTEPSNEPEAAPTSEPSNEPESAPTTCTLNDLVWIAEMRGSNGMSITFPSTDNLSLVGLVQNPCVEDFVLTTNSTCLLGGGIIQGHSTNTEFLHQPFCGSALTDWVIVGGGSVEEVVPVEVLPIDTYTLQITFGDSMNHTANASFSVVQ